MSRRFTITVPDDIGHVIDNSAAKTGLPATGRAAFYLEAGIRQMIDDGKIPRDWERSPKDLIEEQDQSPKPNESEVEQMKALEVLRKLATKTPVSTEELTIAAAAININTNELLKVVTQLGLRKNGNV